MAHLVTDQFDPQAGQRVRQEAEAVLHRVFDSERDVLLAQLAARSVPCGFVPGCLLLWLKWVEGYKIGV